jgi:dTDP-4-dehydrorhamnose reductase
MAEEANRLGAILIHYSTDYVFDGELDRPYLEEDPPNPVNTYGKSKLAGERAIEAVGGQYLILRTSWVYSARGSNFVLTVLRLAREKPELVMVDDHTGSPTWARALATATAQLLRRKELIRQHSGVYHLAASGHASRFEFTRAIIDIMEEISGTTTGWASVKPTTSDQFPLPAKRPRNPVISKDRIEREYGIKMLHWRDQVRTFLRELAASRNWGR